MIDPKSISPLDLPCVAIEKRNTLPKSSGIYFAIDSNDCIQYIGRSVNIQSRWSGHHRLEDLRTKGIRIAWLDISDVSLLDSIERALIKYFKPPLNNQLVPKKGEGFGLEALRISAGLTVKELADRLGRSEGMIRSWERGTREPTLPLREVVPVLDAYQCTVDQLVEAIEVTRPRNSSITAPGLLY